MGWVWMKIIGTLLPQRKPAGSLDGYDLYLRALALSHQFTPESLGEAVFVLRKAMEIDSSFAPAAALSLFRFSWWHSEARGERPQTDEAVRLARRMMANTTDDPLPKKVATTSSKINQNW
jgi:hypothetical protein